MQKEPLSTEQTNQLNSVVLKTTLALFLLIALNFISVQFLKIKIVPFPDGVILICGLILLIRSTILYKLEITRRYFSKLRTNLFLIGFVGFSLSNIGYYVTNPNLIMSDGSLSRNFIISIGMSLLIGGVFMESYTGYKALLKDTNKK